MKIPSPQHTITALVDAAHEARRSKHADVFRPHMGASTLGEKCDRKLWLGFRWAVREQFPGRVLRLFRRGQNEEAQVVEDLRSIGCKVRSTGADQTRVDFGSHVSGSIDGIITSGVPDAPKKAHVLEIKTHSRKSFDALEKEGVEAAQPKHFAQVQAYMLGTGIDRALYVAVCKDDDRLHVERFKLDKVRAERLVERGQQLATQDEIPPPLSSDPTWFECKFCSAHDFCHGSRVTKEVNCRTCAHSTAEADGTWTCARHDQNVMPTDWMREAHECHALHEHLAPWPITYDDAGDAVHVIDGTEVRGFASTELIANPKACVDPTLVQLRRKFDAKVVG